MVRLPKTTKTTKITLPTDDSNPTLPADLANNVQQGITQQAAVPGIGGKEREFFAEQDAVALEEIRKDLEVAPEVKEAGIEARKEEIELPPAIQKMGVVQSDANQPVTPVTANLPITDDKIVTGTGAPVVTSLRWLVEWCLRQLKKVHIKLKKVHGRIIRVVTR